MGSLSSWGLLLAEVGLVMGGAVAARLLLAHELSPDEIPRSLRQRVAMIDRFRSPLWVMATALCLTGLGLHVLA